jgi:hypothetical protein
MITIVVTLSRFACQFGCPRSERQIGDNRLQAVLGRMLVVDEQIIEYAHHRPLCEDDRFLKDRHALAVGKYNNLEARRTALRHSE